MNYAEKVEQARAKIKSLSAEHAALTAQPRSRKAVDQLVRETVQRATGIAAGQSVRTFEQLAAGLPADLLTVTASAVTAQGPLQVRVDLLPVMVRLLGGAAVIKALSAGLDNIPEGLTTEARAERLATVTGELVDLQTQEEQLIREAGAAGEDIQRRADAGARFVLALEV